VAYGVVGAAQVGVIRGEQAAGTNVLRNQFELAFENHHFHFAVATQLFGAAKAFECIGEGNVNVVIVTVGFDGLCREFGGLFKTAGSEIGAAENVVDPFAIGFEENSVASEVNGFVVLTLGIEKARPGNESFGESGIEFQGLAASSFTAFDPFGIVLANLVNHRTDVGDASVGRGEAGVQLDGLLVHLQGKFEAFAASIATAAKEVVVGDGILGGFGCDLALFLRRKSDAKRLGDAAGDFVLDFEDVGHFAVETLRPNGVAGTRFDELRADAEPIAGAANTAAENVSGMEFAPDFGRCDGLIAVS